MKRRTFLANGAALAAIGDVDLTEDVLLAMHAVSANLRPRG